MMATPAHPLSCERAGSRATRPAVTPSCSGCSSTAPRSRSSPPATVSGISAPSRRSRSSTRSKSLYYGVKDGRISIARHLDRDRGFCRDHASECAQDRVDPCSNLAPASGSCRFGLHVPSPSSAAGIPVHRSQQRGCCSRVVPTVCRPAGSISAQFWCVEEPDYLFHRLVPGPLISPMPRPDARRGRRQRQARRPDRPRGFFALAGAVRRQKACW